MKFALKRKHFLWLFGILGIFIGVTGFIFMRTPSGPFLDPDNFSSTPLSDETKVLMMLDNLKRNIREQKIDEIASALDEDFKEDFAGKRFTKKDLKDGIDKLMKTRKKVLKSRPQPLLSSDDPMYTLALSAIPETSTSDFEMAIDSLSITDNGVEIKCRFQFCGDLKDGKFDKERVVRMKFLKSRGTLNDTWKIKESTNLSDFFE